MADFPGVYYLFCKFLRLLSSFSDLEVSPQKSARFSMVFFVGKLINPSVLEENGEKRCGVRWYPSSQNHVFFVEKGCISNLIVSSMGNFPLNSLILGEFG